MAMTIVRVLALAATALLAAVEPSAAAGLKRLEVPLPDGTVMQGAVWYPADAPLQEVRIGPYAAAAAPGAPVAPGRHPLVILSHGTGGWFGGHTGLALALADAGFIVAAVTHPGDNRDDRSGFAGQRRLLDRPRHLAALARHMTAGWGDAGHVDAGRIAVFGYSVGGYDAVVAAGGVPDFTRFPGHCGEHGSDPLCGLMMAQWDALPRTEGPLPTLPVRAVVLAAPALGVLFDREALAGIAAPVQIWQGDRDELLQRPFHADRLAEGLGERADLRIVAGAGHFAFMPPCPEALRSIVPEICTDPSGFDRAAFHETMNAEVVRFLRAALAP